MNGRKAELLMASVSLAWGSSYLPCTLRLISFNGKEWTCSR